MSSPLALRLARRLDGARGADGGFGARPGEDSEPEPTALAAIALDDDRARAWLAARQRDDGSFGLAAAAVFNDSATSLCALALPPGPGRERALDYLTSHQAPSLGRPNPVIPMDTTLRGWGWTPTTFGWVEPTARALLALRLLRPDAPSIADGVRMLADRSSVHGGWNYGNRLVYDTALEPYAQTTALALLGLQGAGDPAVVQAGYAALRRLWPNELGGLSLAVTLAALHVAPASVTVSDSDLAAVEAALSAADERSGFLGDLVALAWAVIATSPAIDALRVTR